MLVGKILLLVVMPLTVALIAVFGYYAMGLSFGGAVLLGAVLAPTDPVLAGDVGLGPPGSEPVGEPRFSLHTEAAINDGLASPFIVFGLFVATEGGNSWIGEWAWADAAYAVGVALVLGAFTGSGSRMAGHSSSGSWLVSRELDGFAAIALLLVVYGLSELVGSYGLIALFVAGVAFRRYEFDHEINARDPHGADVAGTLLELLVLLLLGSMLTHAGLSAPGWSGWLLAPLLIFVIRPALVLATSGPGLASRRERFFLAFFGVRGVAALFYAAIVAGSGALSSGGNRGSGLDDDRLRGRLDFHPREHVDRADKELCQPLIKRHLMSGRESRFHGACDGFQVLLRHRLRSISQGKPLAGSQEGESKARIPTEDRASEQGRRQ